uniref:Replication associated protein n=1 Tax=Smacoviridae sp. TaxID=2715094 RepID=A0A6M3YPX6_9VIRU|nr:MAG: replication associated protein [Smacoviridae sp.]
MVNLKWIDATIWVEGDSQFVGIGDENEYREKLDAVFERYVYGREVAPDTGRRHLQFRGVLRTPYNRDTAVALASLGFRNITPTHVRNFDYVKKGGDYYVSWETFRPEFKKVEETPHVWQVQLDAMEPDDRTIEFIVDDRGNAGKTAWAMYHQYKHDAIYIPPVSRGIDVCSAVINKGVSSWYIVDTPRAFEFNNEWAVGLEQLKNGYVFDTRNSFKDLMLPARPRITVLCNDEPADLERYFSKDRILLMRITEQGYLWEM